LTALVAVTTCTGTKLVWLPSAAAGNTSESSLAVTE
jgi:hypothetical protein